MIHLDTILPFPAEFSIDGEYARTCLSYPGIGLGAGSRTRICICTNIRIIYEFFTRLVVSLNIHSVAYLVKTQRGIQPM